MLDLLGEMSYFFTISVFINADLQSSGSRLGGSQTLAKLWHRGFQ